MPAPAPPVQQSAAAPQSGNVQQNMANAMNPPPGQGQLPMTPTPLNPQQMGRAAQPLFGTNQPTPMPQATQPTGRVAVQQRLPFSTATPPGLEQAFAALGTPQQAAPQQAAQSSTYNPGLSAALNTLSPQSRGGSWQAMVDGLPRDWGGPSMIPTDNDWSPNYRPELGDDVQWKAFAPFCFPTEDGMLRKATPHEVGLYAALRYLGWL